MDYGMLVGAQGAPGSISRWINYGPVQQEAPEIVVEAESWVYRRLRHWKMLTPPVTGNLTIGQDFLPNPADMLEPFLLVTTGQFFQEITQKPMQEVIANWAFTGTGVTRVQQQPLMFAFDQSAMRFDSPPDQAYAYAFIYYQQPQPLSVTNTNFLTQTYPRLMRLTCMAAACEFAKDSGQGQYDRTYWDQLAQDEIDKAQAESDRARRGTVAGAIMVGGGIASNFPAYVTGW